MWQPFFLSSDASVFIASATYPPKSTTNTATTPQAEINLLSIPAILRYALNVGEGEFSEVRPPESVASIESLAARIGW